MLKTSFQHDLNLEELGKKIVLFSHRAIMPCLLGIKG
jgi:hypothetical protein